MSVCEQMMVKFPRAKKVITTLRGSISASHNTWAGVLYDGKTLFQTRQYQITELGTISPKLVFPTGDPFKMYKGSLF